ncbi:MAG: hypothetical protein QXV17_10425 [Candidatus Micrarchaeaceae archaeon]
MEIKFHITICINGECQEYTGVSTMPDNIITTTNIINTPPKIRFTTYKDPDEEEINREKSKEKDKKA